MGKIIFLIITLLLLSCGSKNKTNSSPPGLSENIQLGSSSSEELIKELGEPKTSYQEKSTKVFDYQDFKSYQFVENKLKGFFREPVKDEVYLQYWLQLWKNKTTTQEEIHQKVTTHTAKEFQLICIEEKTTIVYDSENGHVKRVMYYEK